MLNGTVSRLLEVCRVGANRISNWNKMCIFCFAIKEIASYGNKPTRFTETRPWMADDAKILTNSKIACIPKCYAWACVVLCVTHPSGESLASRQTWRKRTQRTAAPSSESVRERNVAFDCGTAPLMACASTFSSSIVNAFHSNGCFYRFRSVDSTPNEIQIRETNELLVLCNDCITTVTVFLLCMESASLHRCDSDNNQKKTREQQSDIKK